jgi:hypothetical protein
VFDGADKRLDTIPLGGEPMLTSPSLLPLLLCFRWEWKCFSVLK